MAILHRFYDLGEHVRDELALPQVESALGYATEEISSGQEV
jgi:hypothetical protein